MKNLNKGDIESLDQCESKHRNKNKKTFNLGGTGTYKEVLKHVNTLREP